jgi:dipeptidyl aminopeptidase/acylaminoacyl peptidase
MLNKILSQLLRALTLSATLAAAWLVTESASAAESPLPLADFFRHPATTSVVVSPSGRYLALVDRSRSEGRRRLVVLDMQDLTQAKSIASFEDADILGVRWVNDDRLVFMAGDESRPIVDQAAVGWGMFAVARDGKAMPRRLTGGRGSAITPGAGMATYLSLAHRLIAVPDDGSDDVILERAQVVNTGDVTDTTLLRLNTVTGAVRSLVEGAPDHVFGWALDEHAMPRAALSHYQGHVRLFLKPVADGPWALAQEYDDYQSKGAGLTPLSVSADGKLYARGYSPKSADKTSLLSVDIAHPEQTPKVLMSLDGYDFTGTLIPGAEGRLLGIHYQTDAWATYWFDPRLKKIQADVDAAIPGLINFIQCGACSNLDHVLVTSWSDRQPPVYQVYDTKSAKLVKVGEARPWINAKAMAERSMEKFAARDGMTIPVYVTRPPGLKGPAPMVVLVHGGPQLRGGDWAWDSQSQFLASRGYVVVEPEFRGGTGFGWKHFQAGWKQWGLAMQDDLADAARWAVGRGYGDANRVCIAGASYGGYATLMGLVRDPDLYRCGVEWAGVTDIDLMYSISWSDMSQEWKHYGMPLLIGDREKDAKQLVETSPLKQAARITRPVLMAHGDQDRRVPIEQGKLFRDAVRQHNPNVEWIEYAAEGHGWALESTDLDFWSRVERFLDKNLKNAP